MIIPNNALVPHEATQFEPGALVNFGTRGVCILEETTNGGLVWSAYGHAWSKFWTHAHCISSLATLDDLTREQEEAGKRRHDCNTPGCWCGRAMALAGRPRGRTA
jgi:hypothetical protein